MDTKCICRLCGKQVSKTLINIFDPDNDYAKKINALLPVYVHEDDCLPKYMCNDCHDNVLKFHKFYRTTLETDIELKSQLPWMQKRVEEIYVGIPMVKCLNSKTLAIATELENFSCFSTKLPEDDLIKTIDSSLVSVPVRPCPCSYSCSSCLHVDVEDPNAFDQSIDELSDSNKDDMAQDPLAPEIPVDIKDIIPPNNFMCVESKDVVLPDVKPAESFHRTLRPRQKSTDLPPKKSSLKSKIRKGKRKVRFTKRLPGKPKNSKKKNVKTIDSKVWQRIEIKAEKFDDNFKADENLRTRSKTKFFQKHSRLISNCRVKNDESIIKVDKKVDCDEFILKKDPDNENVTNIGHMNNLFECTDNFNGVTVNNSIINSNSNINDNINTNIDGSSIDFTIKPNVTNKTIIIKKECMNELSLMDVSVKLEKMNVDNVDEKLAYERTNGLSDESKTSCKDKKLSRKNSTGGKKRKRKRKKLNKSQTNNNTSNVKINNIKVDINNLFETLNLSSSSGRVECDLCKKSFATREVFNLHYCCN